MSIFQHAVEDQSKRHATLIHIATVLVVAGFALAIAALVPWLEHPAHIAAEAAVTTLLEKVLG